VPVFRSRSHFRVPTLKLGPVMAVVVVVLVVVVLAVLAVIEPRPSMQHFEVPVANDRFAH